MAGPRATVLFSIARGIRDAPSAFGPCRSTLAFAFGVVLGQMVEEMTAPPSHAAESEATGRVVRSFYEAANAVIATGDVAALDQVVAPAYRDHATSPGTSPDQAGLGRSLAAIHACRPVCAPRDRGGRCRADRAAVRVTLVGLENGTFAGWRSGMGLSLWGDLTSSASPSGASRNGGAARERRGRFSPRSRRDRIEPRGRFRHTLERVVFAAGQESRDPPTSAHAQRSSPAS